MFRVAHATGANWMDVLHNCLSGFDLPTISQCNLGIIYATEAMAPYLEEIVELLRVETGIDDWVGGIGLGICASGIEYFDEPALAIMGLDIPSESYDILPTRKELHDGPIPANTDLPDGKGGGEFDVPPLVLIHADSANADVLGLIDEIAHSTGGYLIGGLTASDVADHHVAGEVTGGGVSGVAFSSDLAVTTSLSQGCAPIGEMHVIGRANDNIIAELDGRPALDVFKDDIGEVLAKDLNRVAGYIHAALPVSGSDTGDYVVRNLVGIDVENRIIAIGAPVSSGSIFVEMGFMLLGRLTSRNGHQSELFKIAASDHKRFPDYTNSVRTPV
jgi:small ligand-binding sensory domain FIST